jgi:aldose 1-epimerase
MMSNIVHRIGPDDGLQITVAERGAAWLSCRVPLPDGTRREVLLGHASAADYAHQPGFLGAVVGRYANRMGGAQFSLDGVQHHLLANEGANQLHGGPDGFDRRNWTLQELGPLALRLQLHSPAGDQGYPGNLEASVTYRIDAAALAVTLQFEAGVDQPCPVNLAGHAYFNLDARQRDVLAHRLRVAASTMLPVDATMIPLGQLAPVADTAFDLRQGRAIGERLGQGEQQALARGYDHCFALDAAAASGRVAAAELTASDGSLSLQLFTNYPGLQVYSGNHVQQARGRDGQPFAPHAGVALEAQFFPNAPNHPDWCQQGCLLRPGERLQRWMRLHFHCP